jgi:phenylpropionate dioxygenase-like ring-hydroxylating dioxygenase large terminal subunit
MDEMQLVERRDYIVECNWKVYVDNYLEGYHIPAVPLLLQVARPDSRPEGGRGARRRPPLHSQRRGRR